MLTSIISFGIILAFVLVAFCVIKWWNLPLTTFYFCAIEPRMNFFDIPFVKLLNNIVIISTCAFTGALFLIYMPSFIAEVGDGETIFPVVYLICFLVILAAAFSSTDLKFVRVLSVCSTILFLLLILYMFVNAGMSVGDLASTRSNIGSYFINIHKFIIPLTDYHEFYLLALAYMFFVKRDRLSGLTGNAQTPAE